MIQRDAGDGTYLGYDQDEEHLICQRCGFYKDSDPSDIPGDDLCGYCRSKTDKEDMEEAA